jgi:hypothetical protein
MKGLLCYNQSQGKGTERTDERGNAQMNWQSVRRVEERQKLEEAGGTTFFLNERELLGKSGQASPTAEATAAIAGGNWTDLSTDASPPARQPARLRACVPVCLLFYRLLYVSAWWWKEDGNEKQKLGVVLCLHHSYICQLANRQTPKLHSEKAKASTTSVYLAPLSFLLISFSSHTPYLLIVFVCYFFLFPYLPFFQHIFFY